MSGDAIRALKDAIGGAYRVLPPRAQFHCFLENLSSQVAAVEREMKDWKDLHKQAHEVTEEQSEEIAQLREALAASEAAAQEAKAKASREQELRLEANQGWVNEITKANCNFLDSVISAAEQIYAEFDCLSDHVKTPKKIKEQIGWIIRKHVKVRQ